MGNASKAAMMDTHPMGAQTRLVPSATFLVRRVLIMVPLETNLDALLVQKAMITDTHLYSNA